MSVKDYLNNKGSQNNGTEDRVVENALKHVPFSVDLASVELVEDLHEDECVENNRVVFRGRRVKWGIPATVDVKHLLTYKSEEYQSMWILKYATTELVLIFHILANVYFSLLG